MSPVPGHSEKLCFFAMPPSPRDDSTMRGEEGLGAPTATLSFLGFFNLKTCQSKDLISRAKVCGDFLELAEHSTGVG